MAVTLAHLHTRYENTPFVKIISNAKAQIVGTRSLTQALYGTDHTDISVVLTESEFGHLRNYKIGILERVLEELYHAGFKSRCLKALQINQYVFKEHWRTDFIKRLERDGFFLPKTIPTPYIVPTSLTGREKYLDLCNQAPNNDTVQRELGKMLTTPRFDEGEDFQLSEDMRENLFYFLLEIETGDNSYLTQAIVEGGVTNRRLPLIGLLMAPVLAYMEQKTWQEALSFCSSYYMKFVGVLLFPHDLALRENYQQRMALLLNRADKGCTSSLEALVNVQVTNRLGPIELNLSPEERGKNVLKLCEQFPQISQKTSVALYSNEIRIPGFSFPFTDQKKLEKLQIMALDGNSTVAQDRLCYLYFQNTFHDGTPLGLSPEERMDKLEALALKGSRYADTVLNLFFDDNCRGTADSLQQMPEDFNFTPWQQRYYKRELLKILTQQLNQAETLINQLEDSTL